MIHFEVANAEHSDRLKLSVTIPDEMWFGIGFGDSMVETDIIAWHAMGNDSYVEDYYSTSRSQPKVDD